MSHGGSELKGSRAESGLATEWRRHSHMEEAGCRATTLCHSAGPATGLTDGVDAPERSQAGTAKLDA